MGLFDRLFRRKRLLYMQPSDSKMWQASRRSGILPRCDCLNAQYGDTPFRELNFHTEAQNTDCEAWQQLNDLIEAAAFKGSKEFAPGLEMTPESWSQITTLPTSISKLNSVKKLYLYGSHLTQIPPEIGLMINLEELDLYTSYRLHWLPYEVTRCAKLNKSRISTRALYGNYKYRPPFPRLGSALPQSLIPSRNCSVCDQPFQSAVQLQVWLSIRVGTDVLPLLVNACSKECIGRLPRGAKGYVDFAHTGGLDLIQPVSHH